MRNKIMTVLAACAVAASGCASSVSGTAAPGSAGGLSGVEGSDAAKSGSGDGFTPSKNNQDPSEKIDGVVRVEYDRKQGQHVLGNQRVAYTHSPPFGGAHDQAWASCEGMVYQTAVRNENMVHMLEHGAVWIAYHPDQVSGAALDKLAKRVTGQNFIAMSPYPGLDKPVSVQSWGHQLKVDSADDQRIDQFIKALRRNPYQSPEPNANCNSLGPGLFDPDNPPPFDPAPAPADAVPEKGR